MVFFCLKRASALRGVRPNWIVINAIAALFSLLHLFLFAGFVGNRLEPVLMDLWFTLRGPNARPEHVAVIALDPESHERFRVSPIETWPREVMISLLKRLKEAGVKRIAFDVVFAEKGSLSQVDQDLADAFGLVPSILAADTWLYGYEGSAKTESMLPDPLFSLSALSIGHISFPLDFGIIRRFPSPKIVADRRIYPLSFATVTAPRYPTPRDIVNFYGPSGYVPSISLKDVIDAPIEEVRRRIGGKYCFLGYAVPTHSMTLAKDSFSTPFYGGPMFGVELHATAAENIISNSWIIRLSPAVESLILGLLVFFTVFSLFMVNLRVSVMLSGFILFGWSSLSYICFRYGVFLPGATALFLVLPLAFLTSIIFYYFFLHRSQRRIRHAFSHYLAPSMVEKIAATTDDVQLGGQMIEATLLFTDIEGFSAIAEKLDTDRLSNILNVYFSELAQIVLSAEGTLLKFIGDGMFVLWGAPVAVDRPNEKALQSAILIQERMKALSEKEEIHFRTRIGIHRGRVIVGNFGSADRFDYTAIGDGVNLASRLEQLNKHFGTTTLVSDSVIHEISPDIKLIQMGSVIVYNRASSVSVYTPKTGEISDDAAIHWERALSHFSQRHWTDSKEDFEAVKSICPYLKKSSELYLSLIRTFEFSPPAAGWSGEIKFESKG